MTSNQPIRYWHSSDVLFEHFDENFLQVENHHAAPYGFCFARKHETAQEHAPGKKYLYEVELSASEGEWFRFDQRLCATDKGKQLHAKIVAQAVFPIAADPTCREVYNKLVINLGDDLKAVDFLKPLGYRGAVYRSQGTVALYAFWNMPNIRIISVHHANAWDPAQSTQPPQSWLQRLGFWLYTR